MHSSSLFPAFVASLPLAVAITASPAEDAIVSFAQLTQNYNLVSLGDAAIRNYGDTEGGIAVGGNLTIDGGVIAALPSKFGQTDALPTLYVNGSLNYTGNGSLLRLQTGHASLPGFSPGADWNPVSRELASAGVTQLSQISSTSTHAAADPRSTALDPGWDFAAIKAQYQAISSTLASLAPTGAVSVTGQQLAFTAAPDAHGAIIFDLDASLLAGNFYDGQMFSGISIDVPEAAVFVINVLNADGRTLFGGGVNFNYDDSYSRLLWNIVGADDAAGQTVSFGNGGQFYGSILAPNYLVTNTGNTPISGQVVAGSFDYGNAELHFTDFGFPTGFDEPLPPVPEPATYGLAGAGALLGLAFWRRRAGRDRRL
ncbi:hypothetical protein AW736_12990 [Termitidicoccus mucosus]|uniref:Uncharacterized protein n=2 Tax=Termitidicoccus mucosus TaxID=1184151 RepID=A0A178IHP1_9BACT|nr:hypothetical protein AW736_12990 [Opitutaceae bacterium TSB47]